MQIYTADLQFQMVTDQNNKGLTWNYWKGGQDSGWVATGVQSKLTGDQWHHLVLKAEIVPANVAGGFLLHYSGFSLDEGYHILDKYVAPDAAQPTHVEEAVIVHVQLDGPTTVGDGYSVLIDKASLTNR